MENVITYGGKKVRFERRLYGNRTYTFALVEVGDDRWEDLGNPIEGKSWPEARLHRSLEDFLGRKFEAPTDGRFEDITDLIRGFLKGRGLSSDGLIFYTKDEWKVTLAATHGRSDMLAAVNIEESPLYEIVNLTQPGTTAILELFTAYMKDNGYRIESMQAWSLAVYQD